MEEHALKMAEAAFETVIERVEQDDYYVAFWFWNGILLAAMVADPGGVVARHLLDKMNAYSRAKGARPIYEPE